MEMSESPKKLKTGHELFLFESFDPGQLDTGIGANCNFGTNNGTLGGKDNRMHP
jgi:hypothetical protein